MKYSLVTLKLTEYTLYELKKQVDTIGFLVSRINLRLALIVAKVMFHTS